MSSRLFIGRLAAQTQKETLEDVFSKFGRIKKLDVKVGFAFIEYEDERSVSYALNM